MQERECDEYVQRRAERVISFSLVLVFLMSPVRPVKTILRHVVPFPAAPAPRPPRAAYMSEPAQTRLW